MRCSGLSFVAAFALTSCGGGSLVDKTDNSTTYITNNCEISLEPSFSVSPAQYEARFQDNSEVGLSQPFLNELAPGVIEERVNIWMCNDAGSKQDNDNGTIAPSVAAEVA